MSLEGRLLEVLNHSVGKFLDFDGRQVLGGRVNDIEAVLVHLVGGGDDDGVGD